MEDELTSEVVPEEATSLEPSVEETTEEPSSTEESFVEDDETTSNDEPSKLFANKYASAEELEKAYIHSDIEASRMAKKLKKLEKEVELAKMSPEQRQQAQQTAEFVKSNDLMTKTEFKQMQRDQQEATSLISKGATQDQIDRVMKISRFGEYSNMSITEIYKDIYGGTPKQKPRQGVKSKPAERVTKSRPYTKAEIKAMSKDELRSKYADILKRGVA